MKYFIFTLLFALQVLGQNTRVLPRGISIPAGSVLVGNSTGVGTTTPVGISGQFLQSAGTSTPVWKNIQGGGEVNFITNGDGQDGTTGFVTGSYSAADKPAGTFTASSGSSAFEVANTFAPLGTGTTSLTFTKYAGASRQGRAVEYEFNLPVAYRAKVLTIKNQYIINSGTFVAGTNSTNSSMIFYTAFYDGSSWSVAEPSSFKLLSNSSTVSDVFSATVQSPSNATKMKLIAYVSETATTAWEVKANISVSPSTYVFGTPITDWQSYTPTWTGSGGSPSLGNGTLSGRWRRVGQNAEIQIAFTFGSTTNANSATAWQFSYPSGLAINTASLADGGSSSQGSGLVLDSGTQYYTAVPIAISTGIRHYLSSTSPVGATTPMTWANGDNLISTVSVPILGWSSSVQMSDQADTRVVAAYKGFNTPTGTLSNSYNVVKFSGMDKDTHNGYNASTGLYTVPVSGYYRVSSTLEISKTSYSAGNFNLAVIYVNGSAVTYGASVVSGTTNVNAVMVSGTVFANAGDTIGIYSYCSAATGLTFTTSAGGSNFSLERISGPSAIAATESVNLRYTSTAGQSLASGNTTLSFATKDYDSHGAFSSNTTFTAPIAGKYSIKAKVASNTISGLSANYLRILVNGSSVSEAQFAMTYATASNFTFPISDTVKLNAGDTVTIQFQNGFGSTVTAVTTTGTVSLAIERVGN